MASLLTRADREPASSTDAPETSWRFLLLATAAVVAVATVLNIGFRAGRGFYTTVYADTGHLVRPALVSGLVLLAVVFAAARYGGLRPRDLGWRWSRVGGGLVATAVIFVAMQVVQIGVTVADGGQPQLSASWTGAGWAAATGALAGHALGIAPAEETFFRGLLLPRLRLEFSRMAPPVAVGAALVVSQSVFALYHLPGDVLGGSSGAGMAWPDIVLDLARLFVIGLVFAALYLRTGNLFLVIGIHALQNAGTTVVAAPVDPGLVMLSLATVTLLATFVPAVARRLHGIGGAGRVRLRRGVR
jgi:membrane protease YdiL (CAAX protease family)